MKDADARLDELLASTHEKLGDFVQNHLAQQSQEREEQRNQDTTEK